MAIIVEIKSWEKSWVIKSWEKSWAMSQRLKLQFSLRANRFKPLLPSRRTAIVRFQQGGIALFLLAGASLMIPPLWEAVSISPQQRVAPLRQRIVDLDQHIKASKSPSTNDLKEIALLEKGRIDTEHTLRTTLLQTTVGFLGLLTAGIAWKNWQVAQEKQVAERFSKAVEQLGHENNIHVRLGGIYALEQIAKDAGEKYYGQVMEMLTSYVRERSSWFPQTIEQSNSCDPISPDVTISSQMKAEGDIPPLPIDIQAVMTVLARRQHHFGHRLEPNRLDLSNVNLCRLHLHIDANLQGIDLRGANLEGADLEAVNLRGAVLRGAQLKRANLPEVKLQEALLGNANLADANLWSANLAGADLQEANLEKVDLEEANLSGAYLRSANLSGAWLKNANLEKAHLQNVNLEGKSLMGVNLAGANLWSVNLVGAFLVGTNLEGTSFQGTNLEGADLKDPVGLTWEQIKNTTSYTNELLPDYLRQHSQRSLVEAVVATNLATPVSPLIQSHVDEDLTSEIPDPH
jgi:uncharacterized protein YjbI with pentapeptide repeats